jgi:hypothetical protein
VRFFCIMPSAYLGVSRQGEFENTGGGIVYASINIHQGNLFRGDLFSGDPPLDFPPPCRFFYCVLKTITKPCV